MTAVRCRRELELGFGGAVCASVGRRFIADLVRTEPRQSPKAHAISNFAIEPHRTAAKLARRKSKFTL